MIIPVIMAGGSGTRLWPLSRTAFPKQFLALNSQLTMLQETLARLNGLDTGRAMVICNEEHRFLVAEQLRQQNQKADILLEPVGRNTAPAIALAALQALNASPKQPPILLILAADHVITNTPAFVEAIEKLQGPVEEGVFGTLGIVPTEAATGYGYIKSKAGANNLRLVEQFVEKPNADMAKHYVEQGYLWNSGMFMVRADRYLEELHKYRPDIYDVCVNAMKHTTKDMDFVRIDKAVFETCPDESIDFAIMEPLSNDTKEGVVMASLDAGWSDVGSWSALWEIANKNAQGNVLASSKRGVDAADNMILEDTTNSYVYGQERLIATLGLDNIVIVDTPDALLVARKDKVQDIKKIVGKIKGAGLTLHHQHRQVFRPWGKYDSIDNGERYQVKRITVNPGAKLSVQMHHHRAEHWIVVTGTAKVTNGEKTYLVTENESTYIPIGQVHALENPGVIPLEMIEVQSGSYLGEDDIVRLKDKYGRV
ncbi:MAG: mannose-1-phosphate guanylyltransferase/mannose-6-phosphate isomerase [Colwellia sp.]